MVSGLTSSYQVLCLSSISVDRFKASINPYALVAHIDIPVSSLKQYEPRLEVNDFVLGDYIKVKLESQTREMVSKPIFTSVDYSKSSTKLNITSHGYKPETIPLSSLGGLSCKLPSEGRIKVFNRNGEIIMIKVGSRIVNLKKIVKKVLYITDIKEEEVTACDKIDYTGQYNIIEISNLKHYNQRWIRSDFEVHDRIEVKYDSSNRPLSYKLVLFPTQVSKYGDTYQFNISDFGMKAMTEHQVGDIAAYLSSGITHLKVLHTSGNIRAFVHNKNIIRVPKPMFAYYPAKSRPEEAKISLANPQDKMPQKPTYLRNMHNLESNDLQLPKIHNQRRFSSDSSPYSNSSYNSENSSSSLNLSYTLSVESNQRIPIEMIKEHLGIQDDKFNLLTSAFSHARLFNKEKYGYLKAIGVGYLDHLCRNSTHPNALNQFIYKLQSNSGLYQLSLQTKDSRNLLLHMLNSLASARSIYSLEDYYNHPNFMQAYIKELQNIVYNNMQHYKGDSEMLESFKNDSTAPRNIQKYIGNALGVIIFTHSTFDIQPKISRTRNYTLVMNLILLSRHHQACLLYYKYQDQEDTNKPINRDSYRCKVCRLLPHESYFSKMNANECQNCYLNGKNGQIKRINERSPQRIANNPQLKRVNKPRGPAYNCEGCKETTPYSLLKKHCNKDHILCNKCVIISQKKQICIACESLAIKQSSYNRPQYSTRICPKCNQEKPIEYLKCKHFYCSQCLKDHINNQITKTPISTHIQAGIVNITCPSQRCDKLISSKKFYRKILPTNMNTYNYILSILPKENCSKCNQPKPLPHLLNLKCHKFCRYCVLEYFDDQLDRRIVNFTCMMGCDQTFQVKKFHRLMKPNQFAKYQQIVAGREMKDIEIACPGCRNIYKNIQGHEKFRCKQCSCEFCGVCARATMTNGIYQGEGHQPSCIFFKQ